MPAGEAMSFDQFADFLGGVAKELGKPDMMDGLYPKARMVLVSAAKKCFHNGISPDGIPHKPLMHQRVRGSGTPVPLRDTGELMASITAAGPGHIDRMEGIWLVFGTEHVKAWHHFGGEIKATRAKFLCIPVTLEAFYAGSPRNFPGKLFFIWNENTKKGVAVGVAADYRKQTRQAESYKQRRAKIKASMKQAPRLGGVRVSKRPKFKLMSLKAWMKEATKFKKRAGKGLSKFWQKVKKMVFGKPKKKTRARKSSGMKPVRKSKPGEKRIHYILKDKVQVPARPFLGINDETANKLELIAYDHCVKYLKDELTG